MGGAGRRIDWRKATGGPLRMFTDRNDAAKWTQRLFVY